MWSDLTMREKSEVMGMAVKSGLTDLNQIIDLYDSSIEPNIYKKGGQKESSYSPKTFSSPEEMIKAHEGFRSTPYKDGRNKKTGQQWYSVGYGFNDSGIHPNIGRSYIGKQMSRAEADRLLGDYVNNLKGSLKKQLGTDIYNSLTPGQLMAYLDVGYQRPASMYTAAKVHRNSGDLNAVADALQVRGFDDRNADRRHAFLGNISRPSPQAPLTDNQQLNIPEQIVEQPQVPITDYNITLPEIEVIGTPPAQQIQERRNQIAPYLMNIDSSILPQRHKIIVPEIVIPEFKSLNDSYIIFGR